MSNVMYWCHSCDHTWHQSSKMICPKCGSSNIEFDHDEPNHDEDSEELYFTDNDSDWPLDRHCD